MTTNLIKIMLFISLTSCTSFYGEVMSIPTSGIHEWVNVVDFKLINKTVYVLITKERSKIESNLDGHKSKSTFLDRELFISISDENEFLDEKKKLNFKKVGSLKKEISYFTLDFSSEDIKIHSVNGFCDVYSGSCKEFYVDKKREDLSKELFFSRSLFVVIDNVKYEEFLSFKDEIRFKVNGEEKRFIKRVSLKDKEFPIDLMIFNSSFPGQGPIQR